MKKFFKILLRTVKYISISFVLFIVLIEIYRALPGSDETDAVFMQNVDFLYSDFSPPDPNDQNIYTNDIDYKTHPKPIFLSNFHRLKPGNKYSLLYRLYNKGQRNAKDDEIFRMLTIVLSKIDPGEYAFDSENVRVVYTEGGSAWPRSQRGGPLKDGKVTILNQKDNELTVRIQFKHRFARKTDEEQNFDKELTLTKLDFEKASPWLTQRGETIYQETYR